MPLIEQDELGLFIQQGPRRIRPLGVSQFKPSQTLDCQHLPGTPLRGVGSTGNPTEGRFEEVWTLAEDLLRPGAPPTKREAYALSLGEFYQGYPKFDAEAPLHRLADLQHPTVFSLFSSPREQMIKRGEERLQAMLERSALDQEANQPSESAARLSSRSPRI